MNVTDIADLTREDLLAAVGLAMKPSPTGRVLAAAGLFGAGLVVGAGVALLLAPKSGRGLREDLTEQVSRLKNGVRVESREDGDAPVDEAR